MRQGGPVSRKDQRKGSSVSVFGGVRITNLLNVYGEESRQCIRLSYSRLHINVLLHIHVLTVTL